MLLILLTIFFALTMRARAAGPCPAGAPVSGNNCYFIAANGSDSNSGTSETSPWQHAPGMPNCTSTCAGVTPTAGEGFIFRGGDTWHLSASTSDSSDSAMGGQWNWSWSGSSTNCAYPFTGSTASCIYLGVDTTWYNSSVCGSSFCRPKFSMDNPTWANSSYQDSSNPGFVTACTYDDYNLLNLYITGSYIQLDNFEFLGQCWATLAVYGDDNPLKMLSTSTDHYVTNIYYHGWTMFYYNNGTTTSDGVPIYVNPSQTDRLSYSVFDGSDSGMACDGSGTCTGGPIWYGGGGMFDHNICRKMSNCLNQGDPQYIYDNLFEYDYESPQGPDHGALWEPSPTASFGAGVPFYFYNNVIRHTNIGETLQPMIWNSSTNAAAGYIFNNTLFDIGNGGNCIMAAAVVSGTANSTLYIYNNTFGDDTCDVRTGSGGNWMQGVVHFANNHLIDYTSISGLYGGSCATGVTCADDTPTTEIFQTQSAANGQGYTQSNNYQPTTAGGATVGAGTNESSECSIFDPLDNALCSGSTDGVSDASGTGVIPVLDILQPALRSSSWDAGAYQFGGQSSQVPAAPTALVATVQ